MTIADLRREAKRHGAAVEGGRAGRYMDYVITAPAGFVWACSSIHMIVVNWRADDPPEWRMKEMAIEDAIARMADGLAVCDDPECEYCHPEIP